MSSGNKRSAEDESRDEEKACKRKNCTELSAASTLMPQDCDLSGIEGILAFISFPYEDIVGNGIMKHYIILRLLYAARVNGADLFRLGEVCYYYFITYSKFEYQFPSIV
jgi:hypothetical protein